ncbi:hypothetical protein M5K25_009022 [Dendrobium thyrsiflorum]|uniref:Uncharacterized protein n=1 Tax=Dendrobium thyrsiflorum TaxID=117978 RepID=A0ABD0VBB5_DENTH
MSHPVSRHTSSQGLGRLAARAWGACQPVPPPNIQAGLVTSSTLRSESVVRRPGKAPRRAVPNPSPSQHAAARSRRECSSSSPQTAGGFGTGTPVPNPQSQSFSRSYGSILPTSLAYIAPSTRGCSPWRPDAVMSTTGRGRHSALRIFRGRRGRTGRRSTCGALPAAGPYLWLSRFQGWQAIRTDGRSARAHAPSFTAAAAPSYSSGPSHCPDGQSFAPTPESDERFARQYRCGPPPEFPLASPRSGIVHHLSGPDTHAHTRTLHRRSGSVGGAPIKEDPAHQLPCAHRASTPVGSHACQAPWSVFQDGSNGEPTGRCDEHARAQQGSPDRRVLCWPTALTVTPRASIARAPAVGKACNDPHLEPSSEQAAAVPLRAETHRQPPSASLPTISSTL